MKKKRVSCSDKTSIYERLTAKEIKVELDNIHSTSTVFAIVYNWVNEFKCGHTSCAPCSRRSIEAARNRR